MAEVHFGTDGDRGKAGHVIEIAEQLGYAVGRMAGPDNDVAVGFDPRESSPEIADLLTNGILSAGANAIRVDRIPTPGLAYSTAAANAEFGVMTSASHNPPEDNGVKVIGRGGRKLSDEAETRLAAIANGKISLNGHRGRIIDGAQYRRGYVNFLTGQVEPGRFAGLHLVVDTANGAASDYAAEVYGHTGAKVTLIHNDPNGLNINEGCGSEHLDSLVAAVLAEGADVGIAHDGDADRQRTIDSRGNKLNGDNVLHIISLVEGHKKVVGTHMANMAFELLMAANDIDFQRADVGDRYVLELMEQIKAQIGGEQSGHIILQNRFSPDRAPAGDGMLTGLITLDNVIESGETLDWWSDQLVPFPQQLINVPVGDKARVLQHAEVQAGIVEATAALKGIGRVLVRESGTQEMLRVMVEAKDEADAIKYAEGLAAKIRKHS